MANSTDCGTLRGSIGHAVLKAENASRGLDIPEPALILTEAPGAYTVPQELLKFTPSDRHIFACFFKGTAKEAAMRQIFFHTPLKQQELQWLRAIRAFFCRRQYALPPAIEPLLLRVCYYNWRRYGEKQYLVKSYEHILDMIQWRAKTFPVSDTEKNLREDLNRGIMYWVARDESFQPLLVVRLRRFPRPMDPRRFEMLTVFCFEWALRHLFIPGLVETCVVIFDLRGIAVHQLPMSALTDMTRLLTRQYPFRLGRMHIIHDSLFLQTGWAVARQCLSEVQQQKMSFMRAGFERELLKTFASHQLEVDYGGLRPQIKSFYPFPLAPGPFEASSKSPNEAAILHCWKAVSADTCRGVLWEDGNTTPIQWSHEAPAIFLKLGLPWTASNVMTRGPLQPLSDRTLESCEEGNLGAVTGECAVEDASETTESVNATAERINSTLFTSYPGSPLGDCSTKSSFTVSKTRATFDAGSDLPIKLMHSDTCMITATSFPTAIHTDWDSVDESSEDVLPMSSIGAIESTSISSQNVFSATEPTVALDKNLSDSSSRQPAYVENATLKTRSSSRLFRSCTCFSSKSVLVLNSCRST